MMSSKPLAVIFFSEETLPPNFRIVSRPNVGTFRKLCMYQKTESFTALGNQPHVKLLDRASTFCLAQPEDMCDEGSAITKLNVVHDVNGHQLRWIEIEFGQVSILS